MRPGIGELALEVPLEPVVQVCLQRMIDRIAGRLRPVIGTEGRIHARIGGVGAEESRPAEYANCMLDELKI